MSIADLLKRAERYGIGVQLGIEPKVRKGIAFVRLRRGGFSTVAEGPYRGDCDSYEEPLQRALDDWGEKCYPKERG